MLILTLGAACNFEIKENHTNISSIESKKTVITAHPSFYNTPTRIANEILSDDLSSSPTMTPLINSTPTTSINPMKTIIAISPSPSKSPIKNIAPVISSGKSDSQKIALTFDQGVAGAGESATVLDILKLNNVKSTIFVTGIWAEQNPNLLKRIVEEGNELGNHSYDHPDFTKISDEKITEQMEKTEQIVIKNVDRSTKPLMRPPYGAYDNRVLEILGNLGYEVIFWTLDSTDWRGESTKESIIKHVTEKSKGGYIIIFHGYLLKTAEALPEIITNLKQKGFKLDTVSNILGRK